MPDPLSLTLAVLALSTAVKDIIEVFDQLKDAFSEAKLLSRTKSIILTVNAYIYSSYLMPMRKPSPSCTISIGL